MYLKSFTLVALKKQGNYKLNHPCFKELAVIIYKAVIGE